MMTDNEIKARVSSTPAQEDGRPALCLCCGETPVGASNTHLCNWCLCEDERVTTDLVWRICDAWDARKATPAQTPRPAPAAGQVWRHGQEVVTLLRPEHDGAWYCESAPGLDDGLIFASQFTSGAYIYVRGPAPVDAVPVGSRWRFGASGYSWFVHDGPGQCVDGDCATVTRIVAGFAELAHDSGARSTGTRKVLLLYWTRIDTPTASESRPEGAAAMPAPVAVRPDGSATPPPLPRETPPRVTQPPPVPCKHGCGANVSFSTRHLLRNGRDWSCVELPVSAAVVAEMRTYRERRGGGR